MKVKPSDKNAHDSYVNHPRMAATQSPEKRKLMIEMLEWRPKTFEECMKWPKGISAEHIYNQVRSKWSIK